MKKQSPIIIYLFVAVIFLRQCSNPTKSQVNPEIIFSKPYYTTTIIDTNTIEYKFDLEFMVTAKNCYLSTCTIRLNEICVLDAYNPYGDIQPMVNHKLLGPLVVTKANYVSQPKISLKLYNKNNDEEIVKECMLTERE